MDGREGRKERRKGGRGKERRMEGRKDGRKEWRKKERFLFFELGEFQESVLISKASLTRN